MGILGLDYRQRCYNCLSPALSVVFVIDDAGSVSGQLQEASKHSVAVVNQARVSTAPFNYILSTTGNKGLFPLLCSKSVNNCQKMIRSSNVAPPFLRPFHQITNIILSVALYT